MLVEKTHQIESLILDYRIQTLTLAEGAGNVALIRCSRAEGGTIRSPFLTAPFKRIGRALGKDKTL